MNRFFLTTFLLLLCLVFLASLAEAQTTQRVTLTWEALTYTHPLYRGKALFPEGGAVRMIALADVPGYAPSQLVYTWQENGTVLGSRSGVGVDSIVLEGSITGRRLLVEVAVSVPGSDTVVRDALVVPAGAPSVYFYEKSPTLGMRFDRALTGTFALSEEELEIVAFPYFFSREPGGLSYKWRMNNRTVTPSNSPRALTLRTGESSGRATVSLEIQNLVDILERAKTSLTLSF